MRIFNLLVPEVYSVNMSLVVYLCLFPNSVSEMLQHKNVSANRPTGQENASRCCPFLFCRFVAYLNFSFRHGPGDNSALALPFWDRDVCWRPWNCGWINGDFLLENKRHIALQKCSKERDYYGNIFHICRIFDQNVKAWVTISFSFCIFFWIVVAMGMFIDNFYCYSYYGWYCYTYYPYAFIGELLCFMIQWGFLFYFINMLGSPCQVKRVFFGFMICSVVLSGRLLLLY